MKHAVIVLPTYNEKDNIVTIVQTIFMQAINCREYLLSILVVDDASPDGTANLVKTMMLYYPNLHLISGKKQGLGVAYVRGFRHAMQKLHADVVFEMDADFSHDPIDIPRFLAMISQGADFVIGSRYIKNGSIPNNWSKLRKLNSKWGNIFARKIAGISSVQDCTSGYRAINTKLLERIPLHKLSVKGYAFQLSLLYNSVKKGAIIVEIPITFKDRVNGTSKIRISDVTEFVKTSFTLRFPKLRYTTLLLRCFLMGFLLGIAYITNKQYHLIHYSLLLLLVLGIITTVLILQGLLTLYTMIYAWENGEELDTNLPDSYINPYYSFTAIIPARHEGNVIEQTIYAVNHINYPSNLKQILVVCRYDDDETIAAVKEAIAYLDNPNIALKVFYDGPINKPHGLNAALADAKGDIVVIFDAEDEPHPKIYQIINTVMLTKHADVVQSGVQLMNITSRWFSALNVLEYFFWFKSSLQFFAKREIIPLGGNTVFFKKTILEKVHGWDEECLTEDGDIGIRLSVKKAHIEVIYDAEYTTREETPSNIANFIKQRTRWNQGFLQIFFKGDWLRLPKLQQKLFAAYILLWPTCQAALFLIIPLSLFSLLFIHLSVLFTLFMFIPLYLVVMQLIVLNIGFREFTKAYQITYPVYMPLVILLTYLPYQVLLFISSLRAIFRFLIGKSSWEKTLHVNAHREVVPFEIPALY